MNPEQWKRVEALFEQAAQLPEGQWPAFLIAETGGDLELIETVLKMLRSKNAEKFIEPPTGSSAPRTLPSGEAWIGRKLGDFELTARVGEGGMGFVFKARQISLNREVAVKILPIESLSHAQAEMLRLGADVEVLAPPELRARLARQSREMATIYRC